MQSFSELELTESIHAMLERVGFTKPTPIQAAAVPLILAGKDVIGVAGTGTGKTLAFALPILKRAETSNDPSLILCPTRELAIQIRDVFYKLLGPKPSLKVTLLIGGAPMSPQTRSLKLKPQIIIATPGRMMDHLHHGNVTFPKLGLFVLDEADRMLDMGFQPQIEDILKSMPHERQTAMFTATLPPGALRIANNFLRNPEKCTVGEVSKPTQLVKQSTLQATHHTKDAMMLDILNARQGQILVFARTKHRTDKLYAHLQEYGYAVAKIHGGRTQAQRNAAIQGFRGGQFRILVATDVAARGIDVPNISSVINYDLPECGEDYIHRIGRAGRAGVEGEALSLLTPDDRSQWRIISRTVDGSPGGHFGEANSEARGGFRGREERASRGSFSRGGEDRFSGRGERSGRAPTYERSDRSERPERSPRFDRSDRPQRPQFSQNAVRSSSGEFKERTERPQRAERTEKFAYPARTDQFGDRDTGRVARVERPERPRYTPDRPYRPEPRWIPTAEYRPEQKKHSTKSPRKDWAATTPEKRTPREEFSRERTFTKRRAPAVTVSAGVKRRARPAPPAVS